MSERPGSFAIYLRRFQEPSAITLSSVLQRVSPHQPPPPRPFWHRLRPNHNNHHHNHQRHTAANRRPAGTAAGDVPERPASRAAAAAPLPSPASSPPAVIFEESVIVQSQEEQQGHERQRPRPPGLLSFRLPSRKSVSMPSLSRHVQSRDALSEVMSADRGRRNDGSSSDSEEEKQAEVTDRVDGSISNSSSSLIRIFTAPSRSLEQPRARSAPPATAARQTNPTTTPTTPRRPYSGEESEQSFWVLADLEPAIIALRGSYSGRIVQRKNTTILVEERADHLYSLPTYIGKLKGWYTEIECREVFRNMCRLVRILHKQRTVHRNLHLNQFLVNPDTGEFAIRGIFDAAYLEARVPETTGQYYTEKPIHPDNKYRRRYDWYAFRSPELDTYEVSPRHGTATDVWSMGVCLYTLLTGIPPFRGSGRSLRHSKMTAQTAPYEITVIPSPAAQDLIARMIVVNPTCRLTMKQVLAHPWMQNSFATDDVDLSLAQTLFMDWDKRGSSSSHRRRPRSVPRRPSMSAPTDTSNTSSRIVVRGS